jgi:hypothetical protein
MGTYYDYSSIPISQTPTFTEAYKDFFTKGKVKLFPSEKIASFYFYSILFYFCILFYLRGFSPGAPISSHRNDPLVQNIRALYRTPLEIRFRAFMDYPG